MTLCYFAIKCFYFLHFYAIIYTVCLFKGEANMLDYINIKGAKVNNLKGIDVKIPRDKLTVITGLSGSRKIFSCI